MPHYEQDVRPQSGKLKIVELFETVQGEGRFIGVPSVFVRTGMCNLECAGCDTKWDSWQEMDFKSIADEVNAFKAQHIVITGGEPTLWQDQLAELLSYLPRHIVTVESNGAVPLHNQFLIDRVNLWSFSPKVGSLGYGEKFSHGVVLENLVKTRRRNQLKIVLDPFVPEHVTSSFMFLDAVEHSERSRVHPDCVFFQPYDRDTRVNISNAVKGVEPSSYAKDLAALTKLVMERSGSRYRVLPQLHKILIWR